MAAKELEEHKDLNRGIRRIHGKMHFAYAQRILARLSDLDGEQCKDHKGRQNHVGKILEQKPSAAFAQKILAKMSDLDGLHYKKGRIPIKITIRIGRGGSPGGTGRNVVTNRMDIVHFWGQGRNRGRNISSKP
jgi:hypothetical protein